MCRSTKSLLFKSGNTWMHHTVTWETPWCCALTGQVDSSPRCTPNKFIIIITSCLIRKTQQIKLIFSTVSLPYILFFIPLFLTLSFFMLCFFFFLLYTPLLVTLLFILLLILSLLILYFFNSVFSWALNTNAACIQHIFS